MSIGPWPLLIDCPQLAGGRYGFWVLWLGGWRWGGLVTWSGPYQVRDLMLGPLHIKIDVLGGIGLPRPPGSGQLLPAERDLGLLAVLATLAIGLVAWLGNGLLG